MSSGYGRFFLTIHDEFMNLIIQHRLSVVASKNFRLQSHKKKLLKNPPVISHQNSSFR